MEGEGEGRLGCTAEIYDVPIVHGGVVTTSYSSIFLGIDEARG